MNIRTDTFTPVSAEGSEWSGISRYHSLQSSDSATPSNAPDQRNRALATPPVSSGSNGAYDDGVSNGGGISRRPPGSSGNPSPPSSIAISSDGHGPPSAAEESLAEHYVSLKRFLAPSLRDERTNPRSNRAKDKLLRLSAIQFHELSTDVYDELLRRQSASGARRSGPGGYVQEGAPPFLLPEDDFHPRRNQARQKLSTLPTSRFRDLSTDVFYELERRFPRFAGVDVDALPGATLSTSAGPVRTSQVSIGPSAGVGRSPLMTAPRSRNLSISEAYPRSETPDAASTTIAGSDYDRPLPKTFQSSTIVPNKSTIVENDDDDTVGPDDRSEDAESYATRTRRSTRIPDGIAANASSNVDGPPEVRRSVVDGQAKIRQLQAKIDQLENRVRNKEEEHSRLQASTASRDRAVEAERREWSELQSNLEHQLSEAHALNDALRAELGKLRVVNESLEGNLHAVQRQAKGSMDRDGGIRRSRYDDLERRYEGLRVDLQDQQRVTEEVRRDASESLMEMRSLSDRCGQSWEKEEGLVSQVGRLEQELKDWKHHYARARTQVRNLRASTIGPSIRPANAAVYAKDSHFASSNGRIKDVHVTHFQIAVDELLRVARVEAPTAVLDHMKAVVACTRNLTLDVDETSSELSSGDAATNESVANLTTRVSSLANNLITAARTFASSEGISPISLLDAAASNLTAAVVELIQAVKIRPSPPGELHDGELMGGDHDHSMQSAPVGYPLENGITGRESVYSSDTVPNGPSSTFLQAPNPTTDHPSATHPAFEPRLLHGERDDRVMSFGYGRGEQEVAIDELKMYLEDQTEDLVQAVQALVSGIRSNAGPAIVRDYIGDIAGIVENVVSLTTTAIEDARSASLRAALREKGQPVVDKLSDCRTLLLEASTEGDGIGDPTLYKTFTSKLPPMAFEIARETKDLIRRIDQVDLSQASAERTQYR